MSKTMGNTPSRQPSQVEQNRVFDEFEPDVLKHLCTTWDFSNYATKTELPGRDRFYWYQDNGSDILAVAHLDTVQDDRRCEIAWTAAGPLAVSGALDDRLGVYVILELLPALGVTCDWLLTTDEERGQSTGREFAEDFCLGGKQYNWIIQFDRGGTDVVMYQYETKEYAALVEASGAQVGMGSYSDIAEMEDLGCAAYNWGVGYQDYHSPRSHAWLNDTFRSVARFLRFHAANANTHQPHEEYDWRVEKQDDSWLDYADLVVDCGHTVDVTDESTYYEQGNDWVICAKCAGLAA